MARKKRVKVIFRLRDALRESRLSLRGLAQALGCDLTGLRRLKRGGRYPSWRMACALAEALGVSLDYLAGKGA